jgi:hypothetical protein
MRCVHIFFPTTPIACACNVSARPSSEISGTADRFRRQYRSRHLRRGISLGASARLRTAIHHHPNLATCQATSATPAGGSKCHLVPSWTRGIAPRWLKGSAFPGAWGTIGSALHLPVSPVVRSPALPRFRTQSRSAFVSENPPGSYAVWGLQFGASFKRHLRHRPRPLSSRASLATIMPITLASSAGSRIDDTDHAKRQLRAAALLRSMASLEDRTLRSC